ncbi:hypothetical protein Micbo1qcDRAFT_170762 [Microdochium bolleyi]|uniref:Uncharacterized protein n=1 Tax=Microdochium bolleyi TaxID=196109 RepID=A0A136JIN5_9PEZI|nr:hypothetical protein Micbo1qcDRAFT_170762 [Microdochium bolleyi]
MAETVRLFITFFTCFRPCSHWLGASPRAAESERQLLTPARGVWMELSSRCNVCTGPIPALCLFRECMPGPDGVDRVEVQHQAAGNNASIRAHGCRKWIRRILTMESRLVDGSPPYITSAACSDDPISDPILKVDVEFWPSSRVSKLKLELASEPPTYGSLDGTPLGTLKKNWSLAYQTTIGLRLCSPDPAAALCIKIEVKAGIQ